MGWIKSILDSILSLLNVITDGGPHAIIAIIFLAMILMAFANYFIVKFIITFIAEQIKQRDKILAEKDQITKDRIEKTEMLIQQYNKSQEDVVDAIRKIETVVASLKDLIMVMMKR